MGWPALVLAGAIGVWLCGLARATGHALADLHAQQTAAVLAFAMALGQVAFALRRDQGGQSAARAVAVAALGMPLGTITWLALLPLARGAPAVLSCAALLALPLGAASYAAAAALAARPAGAAMAAWLAAAGAGASCAQLAISRLGAEGVLASACLLAAAAALGHGRTAALRGAGVVALFAAATLSAFSGRWLAVPEHAAPPSDMRRLREGARALHSSLQLRFDRWDMGARVQTFELVGRGGDATGTGVLLRDSALAAPLLRRTAASRLPALCERTLLGVPYDQPRPRVLIAGIGGGLELQCAIHHGASRVDVAEPSSAQLDAVRAWLGDQPATGATRVRYVPALARAWATRARTAGYDLVVLASVRDKHALPPGVLPRRQALAETDRGLRELLSALKPSGVLFMIVRSEPAALRLTATADKALRALGAAAPAGHIVVYRDQDSYGILVARSPLGMDRVIALHGRARQPRSAAIEQPALARLFAWPLASPELIWTTGAAFSNRFGELFARAGAPQASRLSHTYVFDIAPASDDRPLFHERTRRDRPDTWPSASPLRALPVLAASALAAALGLIALLAVRLRPAAALRSALALFGLGAGQTLFCAFWLHALALWIDRPEQSFALTALALPGFALMRLPWRLSTRARPWALAVHALSAAAAVPFAPLLALRFGHTAVAVATVLLFALAAAASWYPAREEPGA
jgi:SAM-dependent methyltransferase